VVALGQSIVRALGANEHGDVLGRWMAHRIAELLESAEKTKSPAVAEAARKEATKVIFDVWQQRSHWPEGWPPVSAAAFAAQFAVPRSRWDIPEPTGSIWLDTLGQLDAIANEERRLWLDAALLDLDENQPFDEILVQEAGEEERALISLVAEQAGLARSELARLFRHEAVLVGNRAERGHAVSCRLEELAAQRAELVQQVSEHLDDPPEAKAPAIARKKRHGR
jgi:hypothetical protein